MKADRIRAQITIDPETKALAVILAILRPLGWGTTEKILRTVAAHVGGLSVVRS